MTDYRMPKLAMAMSEGTVTEWLVSDGQFVEAGQALATIETEKVAYDVESPETGFFQSLLPVGETVPCDTVIGRFAETAEGLHSAETRPASNTDMQATTTAYRMPKLAMAMNEGTVTEWLVTNGDFVESGQPLATIETEKVAYDVESPEQGYFRALVAEGETVDCDAVIGLFASSPALLDQLFQGQQEQNTEEAVIAGAQAVSGQGQDAAMPPSGRRIKISPLAKKLASERNINIATVLGSGPGGRIVERDILVLAATPSKEGVLSTLPMTGSRGVIASRMVASLQESAQLTAHWESDITDLLAARTAFNKANEASGQRVSFNALLARALCLAMREVPMANACISDEEITIYDSVSLGMAIALPGASAYDSNLKVGVLHAVERLSLEEIDIGFRELIARVRGGTASSHDLTGSSFTLSSTAGIGPPGLSSTPIINPPNVCVLGTSTPIERAVVRDGAIQARTLLPLALTFDHRALDGEPAARWMNTLHAILESSEHWQELGCEPGSWQAS